MKNLIKLKIETAVQQAGFEKPADFSLESPPKSEMGDFATNVALILSGKKKGSPQQIAEMLKVRLEKDDEVERVEIAGPGFINMFLDKKIYISQLKTILQEKSNYGRSKEGEGSKINVEYISANPTGPLHVGNARSGPIGEALANLHEFFGYEVTREFYVNDRGTQIERFGKSLLYWYLVKENPELELPADGYPAPYVKELSETIQSQKPTEISKLVDEEEMAEFFAREGLRIMVEGIKQDAELLGINFDVWSYESNIIEKTKAREAIDKLSKNGHTVVKDGAVWFRNPSDPDLADKESVLIRSDIKKTLTYFGVDVGYHVDKIDRGAEKLIDVWGSNHAGHIPKMKAALKALGYPEDTLEIVVYQYVRLKRSGKAVSMGKRLGNFVTLREVIESGVHPDAFKYFILTQNANTPIDFDLDLAADKSDKNPVFYIKYAHARIASILRKAEESGVEADVDAVNLNLLENPKERALYKELVKFPELILEVKDNFQIQALPHFAYKIAGLFHDFYSSCRVITDDEELTSARLLLIRATKYVLSNSLAILGIEAPEKM